ncbi:hypothetical protein [Staphylococcus hominis]|uniref:hypothetical protein n=1 Tax=Staphylococcus hominis TaxID=1290 RepID=UPI0011A6436A|nr:hypothetical protein [Staphylococcus hominis]
MSGSSSYSKYTDNKTESFESIIQILDSKIKDEFRNINNEKLITRFEKYSDLKEIDIFDNKYSYKVYKYFHEFINEGFEEDSNRESRISTLDATIIAFSNGQTNQFIINKSNSDTRGKKLLEN